ncbi:efflux RND transporter periplasmic adaptor subunit [Tautonia sociabilis]|uniref:Efflux RND transporter periplasmic adaptor subunit n=1 Tax=Tautonia sociabilis TaxID=2080755 RepID=A0A432ML83_9BACT|nr:efflux RND transporter periplasmic adaptor subunit [Tautonia sociabilis]RUL87967.1 efflux RND transporter periplasmic adaptor subunit [Tautonia sociabilis]
MSPAERIANRSRGIGAALIASGLSALVAAGCGHASSADPITRETGATAGEDVPRIETVRVEQRDLARTIEMPGTVEGYETAELYAKVGGYLEEIHVDIGDEVTKGQELARLHVPEMHKDLQRRRAQLEQARADVVQAEAAVRQTEALVANAEAALDEAKADRAAKEALVGFRQAEYRRYQNLVEQSAARRDLVDESRFRLAAAEAELKSVEASIRTAKTQVDSAKASLAKAHADRKSAQANVDVAQADLEYVETMLRYATIRAPFVGQVTRRWVDTGAFIQSAEGNSPAEPLLTVTRLDRVRIHLDLPMAEVRLLDLGDRAVLDRVNVLPDASIEGEVTRFSPALNLGSRMMRVEIDLENPGHRLRPGYYGYVTVYLDELSDTPVIPSSALLSDGEQKYVYVVSDGTARRRPITTNYEDGIIVGVASGLDGGEQVVRAGGAQITDGQKVVPVLAEAGGEATAG